MKVISNEVLFCDKPGLDVEESFSVVVSRNYVEGCKHGTHVESDIEDVIPGPLFRFAGGPIFLDENKGLSSLLPYRKGEKTGLCV